MSLRNAGKFLLLTLGCLAVLASAGVHAQSEFQGVGEVRYESGVFNSKPSEADRTQALHEAKLSAWRSYTATFNTARSTSYSASATKFEEQLDTFISDVTVLDEMVDEESNVIRVAVRIAVNTGMVDAAFNELAQAGQTSSQAAGPASMLSFVFVAREVESIRDFDDRRTVVEKKDSQATQTDQMADSGGTVSGSTSSSSISSNTTGGSTLTKADEIAYDVSSASDIDSAIGQVFAGNGFEVIPYVDVFGFCGGASLDAIRSEFAESDTLTAGTRTAAIKAASSCDVELFAMGTLDVGLQQDEVDPATGNRRVFVSVRGQIWDIGRGLPRQVASVGPVQYAGLGPDRQVAKRNALIEAAEDAGRVLVDQLNAKGIR
jgi:hypothetical protein